MRARRTYQLNNTKLFKTKLLHWAGNFERSCVLESNLSRSKESSSTAPDGFDYLVAVGIRSEIICGEHCSFDLLKFYYEIKKDWIFGYFSYDLKNGIESMKSSGLDGIQMPPLHFFQPDLVFCIKNNELTIHFLKDTIASKNPDVYFEKINRITPEDVSSKAPKVKSRISREEYLRSVSGLKAHIQKGNIYEVNFCQEFYAEDVSVAPVHMFEKLNNISQTPFAAYYRMGDRHLLSASPERFMKKMGRTIISQPIKGTVRRGDSDQMDKCLKLGLINSDKERSENVMIVDLVRNDLSRSAVKGSVKVEELFGVYTFNQVHQMISTISCELDDDVHFIDAIKEAFPMGSMTGAPKIKAMELIEEYETTKRGLYSGAVGYITPDGDFDFNVVIRSILYNDTIKYLSFIVGGAITALSEPENEYEECMVKAQAMFNVLAGKEYA